MTRSGLIEKIHQNMHELSHDQIEKSVKILLDTMSHSLAADDRVEVRGFGSFELRTCKPRLARNPKNGEPIVVPATHLPHFKPGKKLRESVKNVR